MSHSPESSPRQTLGRIAVTTVALVLFLMWMEGAFEHKIAPGLSSALAAEWKETGMTARVERRETEEVFDWPGTVAALTVTQIAPRVSGRLLEIKVRPGNPVRRGQVLARIDDGQVQARLGQARAALATAEAEARRVRAQTGESQTQLSQARAALAAAEAEARQARSQAVESQSRLGQAQGALQAAEAEAKRARADAVRLENLYSKEAATRQDLDAAQAAATAAEARVAQAQNGVREVESRLGETLQAAIGSADARVAQARAAVKEVEAHLGETVAATTGAADAQVNQARDAVREAESHLSDTVLLAPFDSVVVSRNQEPGDMAQPGIPVITLQQSQYLRVEAAIPATCAGKIKLGNALTARVGLPPQEIKVTVDEIQPAADPQTRTVLVKALLPTDSGAQPGAFAWLRQACGHESVLLVPAAAVRRIGQLESVKLVINGQARLRHVRTGKRFGDAVEILSGLNEGDSVLIAGDR